jgi:hypothetical protein
MRRLSLSGLEGVRDLPSSFIRLCFLLKVAAMSSRRVPAFRARLKKGLCDPSGPHWHMPPLEMHHADPLLVTPLEVQIGVFHDPANRVRVATLVDQLKSSIDAPVGPVEHLLGGFQAFMCHCREPRYAAGS